MKEKAKEQKIEPLNGKKQNKVDAEPHRTTELNLKKRKTEIKRMSKRCQPTCEFSTTWRFSLVKIKGYAKN